MKIERVGANKIKVTVYPEDLSNHGISFESFAANTPAVQDFFWAVMKRAENETDFVAEDGRVLIEAMHLKNEGIVIFISKPEGGVPAGIPKIRRARYRVKPRAIKAHEAIRIYAFESFEDVCTFAGQWRYMGEKSSLYFWKDAYYLLLAFEKEAFDKTYVEAQILEFARPCKSISLAYLEEHGRKICDGDAIAAVTKYFQKDEEDER
ncbi:MAG: adaptor protein MecA [Clostridia bacterium]|nr:adaptor protein MecA [Clostridia bacterium]